MPLEASTTLPSFITQLRQVGQDGYAICDGEIDEGVFSLACPVHLGSMLGLYSIGVVGPKETHEGPRGATHRRNGQSRSQHRLGKPDS
ncbi:hypothetical protein LP417_22125 [Polaromonas sp. P1-6]|nr:hypothetical protein LP417_22125 [Polaromonas sp. P1-6]